MLLLPLLGLQLAIFSGCEKDPSKGFADLVFVNASRHKIDAFFYRGDKYESFCLHLLPSESQTVVFRDWCFEGPSLASIYKVMYDDSVKFFHWFRYRDSFGRESKDIPLYTKGYNRMEKLNAIEHVLYQFTYTDQSLEAVEEAIGTVRPILRNDHLWKEPFCIICEHETDEE